MKNRLLFSNEQKLKKFYKVWGKKVLNLELQAMTYIYRTKIYINIQFKNKQFIKYLLVEKSKLFPEKDKNIFYKYLPTVNNYSHSVYVQLFLHDSVLKQAFHIFLNFSL